jgi:shikimate kinase
MARELERCGADLDEHRDGLTVRGGAPLRGAVVDPEGDHRVAFAFGLLGSLVPGIHVAQPECVQKSYPAFWEDLAWVHAKHRPVALVGMRGAGKTTLGRALAEELGSWFVDADERFEARHGSIAAFVRARGWSAFRDAERAVLSECLQAGVVIATGGGCVEDEGSRRLLAERTFVVWLDAPADVLAARVASSDRPSLTGASLADEVPDVLARRRGAYRSLADRRVDATLPLGEQLQRASAPVR